MHASTMFRASARLAAAGRALRGLADEDVLVACAGAGINLRTGRPTPERVRRAVRKVLGEARYRELAAEHARLDAVGIAVQTVEALAAARG